MSREHMSDDELRYERARNAGLVEPEEMEFWKVGTVDLELWAVNIATGQTECLADMLPVSEWEGTLNDARNELADGYTDLHLRVVPKTWTVGPDA